MTCDKVKSQLSFLPRGETAYTKRLQLFDHLQNCVQCRAEYHQYLKMFYLVDKNNHLKVPYDIMDRFSEEVMNKVDTPELKKLKLKNYFIYATAAAILIITFFFNPFIKNNYNVEDDTISTQKSIWQLIEDEKWENVIEEINSKDNTDELISVSFLISKVKHIDTDLTNNKLRAIFGNDTKKFNELINTLTNYQRYRNNITASEILNYLKTNTKETS